MSPDVVVFLDRSACSQCIDERVAWRGHCAGRGCYGYAKTFGNFLLESSPPHQDNDTTVKRLAIATLKDRELKQRAQVHGGSGKDRLALPPF